MHFRFSSSTSALSEKYLDPSLFDENARACAPLIPKTQFNGIGGSLTYISLTPHSVVSHGVDLRTAALQFSATPDIASALIVGAASEQQIVADYSSMQVRIPAEFWAELKERKLIEQDAPVPA